MIPIGLLLGFAATLHLSSVQEPMMLYVATDGRNTWSGTLRSPNAQGNDGPFATLTHALDVVREMRSRLDWQPRPVTIQVQGGTYFLDEPLLLTPADSGTAEAPVTIAAHEGEMPLLSGGRRIEGWRETTLQGQTVWIADIPEAEGGAWVFRELWVNAQRRQRARHPNQGYLEVAEVPDVTPGMPWQEGQTRFRFKEGDLRVWEHGADAELQVMTRWVESHLPILEIDEAEQIVSFEKRSVFQLSAGDLYYVENALELMDQPGEWYLDQEAGRLYYIPMPGEQIGDVEVIAPRLSQVMHLEGNPAEERYVEHLHFEGLQFSHTEWWFQQFQAQWPTPDVGGFPQAAVGVPGGVFGEGIRSCSFERCAFVHLGTYGLELARGCQQNQVVACEVGDLGAGGIKIGETAIRNAVSEQTYGNEIRDCWIHDGGILFHSAIGIWAGQSYDNRFIGNHIHDFYYSGFSIGWTWGYGKALARGNLVEGNHVHHIGVKSNGDGPILSDMGGIYTLGVQPGTIIRGNSFHDIAGLRYGGWGIYFDEGSTHIVAENNLVYRTTHGGFHQHYGRENVVRNNIFAFARDHQIQRSRPEEHSSFRFERNIVYWSEGKLFGGNLSGYRFEFDQNLYWCTAPGEIRFGELSWEEWRAKGLDVQSHIADPLFKDPEHGDFRLAANSPAFSLGFQAFEPPSVR